MSTFKKILCPAEYSEPPEAALAEAIKVARKMQAKILLLHLMPFYPPPIVDLSSPVPPTPPLEDDRCEAARSE